MDEFPYLVIPIYILCGNEFKGGIVSHGASAIVNVNWLTPIVIRKMALTCSLIYVMVDQVRQAVDVSFSTALTGLWTLSRPSGKSASRL